MYHGLRQIRLRGIEEDVPCEGDRQQDQGDRVVGPYRPARLYDRHNQIRETSEHCLYKNANYFQREVKIR